MISKVSVVKANVAETIQINKGNTRGIEKRSFERKLKTVQAKCII